MKKLKYVIILLCFMFLISGCSKKEVTTPSTSSPLLLEVSKEGTTQKLYLLGSIHAGEESMYPLPDYIMKAYQKSKTIAVELDIIEYEKDLSTQIEMMSKFLNPDDKKITDYIEVDTYEKSVEILKNAGLYNSLFDNYNPMIWQTLLENAMIIDNNLDTQFGIDNYILNHSKEDNKEILELESAQIQYDVLLSLDYDTQIHLLTQTVNEYDISKDNLKQLYELYQKGNQEELEEFVFEEEDQYTKEYNDKFIKERNINMAESLDQAFKEDKNVFCTVGLAHIIGEDGIANLLKQKGYSVKVIKE